jgi:transcription termination factor Rho
MPKARTTKEDISEVDEAEVPEEPADEAEDEGKSRRKKAKAAEPEPRPRRKKKGDDEEPVRPVLTALSRPLHQGAEAEGDAEGKPSRDERPPAATLPPAPEAPAPVIEVPKAGEPMQVIKLNDLKRMKIVELAKMAHDLSIDGYQGLKKQELIFAILSSVAEKRFEVHADGVVEMLSDGFGFLRSADSDYQPSPDDIYVSPSMVRRYSLRGGDTVTGPIRQPREGERFFALLRVDTVNFADPLGQEKILFDNLTPLYPTRKLMLEH